MVIEMLRAGSIEDEDDPRPSPLDQLFNELGEDYPDHIALKYYRSYHSGSAKTLKSIQITLAARLEKFNLESLASLTSTDELELGTLGEKKTALFALIPDNDTSFNFWYQSSIPNYFSSYSIPPTTFTAAVCRYPFIFLWTSSPMFRCLMILTKSYLLCVHARYLSVSFAELGSVKSVV